MGITRTVLAASLPSEPDGFNEAVPCENKQDAKQLIARAASHRDGLIRIVSLFALPV
jgi:hypothetical protein